MLAALAAVTKDMHRLQKEIADIKKEFDSSQLTCTSSPTALTDITPKPLTTTTLRSAIPSSKRSWSPNQPTPYPPRRLLSLITINHNQVW
jgi:hypothetical protein